MDALDFVDAKLTGWSSGCKRLARGGTSLTYSEGRGPREPNGTTPIGSTLLGVPPLERFCQDLQIVSCWSFKSSWSFDTRTFKDQKDSKDISFSVAGQNLQNPRHLGCFWRQFLFSQSGKRRDRFLLSDQEQLDLGDRLRNGDRAAWAALYEAYNVAVWRYVARLVGADTATVADVAQEVFIAAARSARNFDSARGTLWGWLVGIAHRQVALHFRKTERVNRVRHLAEEGALEIREWLDHPVSPGAAWERRELNDLIRGVLAELSADYAALLTAKYLDDRSMEDISREWGSSTEALKSKLARARREFRATFEQLVGTDKTAYLS